MTAFAQRGATLQDKSIATWEIKTLNHRYLDIQLRLPLIAQSLEPILRSYIKSKFKRGRVEIRLHYQPATAAHNVFILNENIVAQLCSHHQRVNQLIQSDQKLDSLQLMSWPGVLQPLESNTLAEPTRQTLIALFEQTVIEVCTIRANEGRMIQQVLLDHLNQFNRYVGQVTDQVPKVRTRFYERLIRRFEEAQFKVDSERFEQELVFMLQKMDVSEELDRLKIHLTELKNQLTSTTVQGSRLDFLMQELNREANTLASKSTEATLNLVVVDIKVVIEAMREQMQNVE